MRIRSIHPEFWRSEDVAAMPWDVRLVFIGLWSYVDDNGVGRDLDRLIVAELFPLEDDPRETLATVSRALQALCDGGQISRYSINGKPYLHIAAWNTWQKIDRPGKARYGLPTCENAIPREGLATASRDPRDSLAAGEGEKGRRGEGEKNKPSLSENADASPDEATTRIDVERLCRHLADRVEANGVPRPDVGKRWRDSARLLLDRDGYTEKQVHWMIDWTQDDEFWRGNIQSMSKLREKFPQLLVKSGAAERRASINGTGPVIDMSLDLR